MTEQVAAAKLNELMIKKGIKIPEYELIDSDSGTHINRFTTRVKSPIVPNGKIYTAEGVGLSKKESKHQAALAFMRKYFGDNNNNPCVEVPATVNSTPIACAVNVTDTNKHTVLQGICLKQQRGKPEFLPISETGPPHSRHFTIQCSVTNLKTEGTGTTKSEARLQATTKMIQLLMQEAEVAEVFESPRLMKTADSKEIFCINENLKGPQSQTPVAIFCRRSSSSASSEICPTSDLLSSSFELPRNCSSTGGQTTVVGLNNNRQGVDNIAESISDDSVSNMSLIDFDDDCQQQMVGGKAKSKSMNNLTDLTESEKTLTREKAINKIEGTFASVEKQLCNEILDTMENRELPRQKSVVILCHEHQIYIDNENTPKIFQGDYKCTDPSIRIACLTKLLMDTQNHIRNSGKKSKK